MPSDIHRPQPDAPLGFVGFHFHLIIAAACWYVGCLFLGMVLDMSDLPHGAMGIMAYGVGPLATTVVCILLGRRLRRVRAARAGLITLACSLVPVFAFPTLLAFLQSRLGRYELRGPDSSLGHRTRVLVRDAGLGIGADFYSDVQVLDANGTVVAAWKDHHGQHPRGGPELLRDSMCWTAPGRLEFHGRCEAAVVELK